MNAQGVVSIRLRPDQQAVILAAADRAGLAVGEFMRQAALDAAHRDEVAELRRRPGVYSFKTPDGVTFDIWANTPRTATTSCAA